MKSPQPTTFFIASIALLCTGLFEIFVTPNVLGFGVPLAAGAIFLVIGSEITRRSRKKQ